MHLIYDGSISKKLWLEQIANKFGDFKIAFSKKVNGEHIYYKHRSIIECSSDENLYFMFEKCNHRQIQPYEIVIDLDDEKAIANVDKICDLLDRNKEEYYCFSTGSKGYHIHIIDKKLAPFNISKEVKQKIEKNVRILLYDLVKKEIGIDVDYQKSSSNVLIAMENTPHWKTGNKKKLYRKGDINWAYL